jgi:hypothetical protein
MGLSSHSGESNSNVGKENDKGKDDTERPASGSKRKAEETEPGPRKKARQEAASDDGWIPIPTISDKEQLQAFLAKVSYPLPLSSY